MKNIIITLLLAVFAISGCTKKETAGPSTTTTPTTPTTPTAPTTGTLQLINNSTHTYDVYINGGYKVRQGGKTSIEYTYSFGTYSVEVKQITGYILYPTVKTYSGSITSSSDLIISYP